MLKLLLKIVKVDEVLLMNVISSYWVLQQFEPKSDADPGFSDRERSRDGRQGRRACSGSLNTKIVLPAEKKIRF